MRAVAPLLVVASVALTASPAAGYEREIQELGERIAGRLSRIEIAAVAVRDFTDLGGEVSQLGRFLAEELSSALVAGSPEERAKRPRVVDRLRLGQVIDEMKLQATGLLDPEDVREIGRIAGVDALVTGVITPFPDTLRLRIRVLDTRSGEELLGDSAELPRTRSLAQLEERSLTVVVEAGECGDLTLDLEGPPIRILEIDDQEIALLGCVRAGETVHCLLELTSRQHDRSFQLFGNSRLVLPDGRQVPAQRVSVGVSTATGSKGKAGDVLVEGVALAATASFGPVPAEAGSIRLLELQLQGDDARFQDVPIERP